MRKRWIPRTKEWVEVDEIYKDPNSGLNGPVYCPDGGYYDMALDKRFESKEEKRTYMRKSGLKMEGNDKPIDKRGVYYFYPGQTLKPKHYKTR